MTARRYFEVEPSEGLGGLLGAQSEDKLIMFVYPPFQGTHNASYQNIAQDKKLAPAEGLDLALLTEGAYTQKTPLWDAVKDNFKSGWVRTPNRVLLIPTGNIKEDKTLSGILVERDLQGRGLDTDMQVPDLSSGWKQNELGIYVSSDGNAQFIPSSAYKGKTFENDGVAHAHLTPEGAEIFAKIARDNSLTQQSNWLANRMEEINSTEQQVSLLCQNRLSFGLVGGSGEGTEVCAFAVRFVAKNAGDQK